MDLSNLLTPEEFAKFAQARRRSHGTDHEVYDDLLAAIRAKYRAEHVPGDSRWDAARRARRMEKHAKKLVRAARVQYEALEALQIAHTNHIAHVLGLPGQREAKELAKAGRSAALGELAAKSLHKTAGALKDAAQSRSESDGGRVPSSLHDLRRGA
ncbi:hypothetical protein AB0G74_27675 [Streptomyces sp. NPDC020875]|uniref:hypothetical protein n=1 Tax=Streptomyces sp. NPDC020875 TaxID=3154898 RepID=UPI0033C391C6